jgi:hypothetical protein
VFSAFENVLIIDSAPNHLGGDSPGVSRGLLRKRGHKENHYFKVLTDLSSGL